METRLFYCARPAYGGWVSFTAHLAKTTGLPLCRPGKRTEKRLRDFGYSCGYRICADLSASPVLITALDRHYLWAAEQFPSGSWLVVHDPTELRALPHSLLSRFRLVTIRQSVQKLLAEKNLASRFLPHPFYPYPRPAEAERVRAVSLSRIDFDKNIDLILEANKKLGSRRIQLYGSLNRLCAHFKLGGMDLDLDYRGGFARDWGVLGSILADAAWVVDMSTIFQDGGGTQYTFLEAIYGGAALILHRRWLEGGPGPFVDGLNCMAVGSAEELAEALEEGRAAELAAEAKKILEVHLTVDWRAELGL